MQAGHSETGEVGGGGEQVEIGVDFGCAAYSCSASAVSTAHALVDGGEGARRNRSRLPGRATLRGHRRDRQAAQRLTVSVFGSVARGEGVPTSDIDFLVDFERGSSLFDLLRLEDGLRELVVRLGGDEFCVLCPDTGLPAAQALALEIAHLARTTAWPDGVQLTFSVGVAEARPGDVNPDEILHRADLALYDAKSTRDTVRIA